MPLLPNGTSFILPDPRYGGKYSYFTFFSEFEPHHIGQTVMEVMVGVIVFLFNVSGNVLVLLAVARYRRMHTVTNVFIASLAASDLLVSLCLPVIIITRLTIQWTLGSFLCSAFNYIQMLTVAISTTNMAVISLDRYFAICRIGKVGPRLTPKTALCVTFAVWTICGLIQVPWWLILKVIRIEACGREFVFCYSQWPEEFEHRVYLGFTFILFYIFPGLLITCNYLAIWRTVKQSSNKCQQKKKRNNPKVAESQVRLVKMFIIIVSLFVLMWLPVYVAITLILSTELITSTIFTSVVLIACANSAINPFLYGFFNNNFQIAFKSMFCFKRVGKIEPAPDNNVVNG